MDDTATMFAKKSKEQQSMIANILKCSHKDMSFAYWFQVAKSGIYFLNWLESNIYVFILFCPKTFLPDLAESNVIAAGFAQGISVAQPRVYIEVKYLFWPPVRLREQNTSCETVINPLKNISH